MAMNRGETEAKRVELAEAYERVRSEPSDIAGHLPTFVELVHSMSATTVIELGTRTGVSTTAWLHALAATGGTLWSVDVDPSPPIGDHDHWCFVRGSDLDPDVVARLPAPADIVFIDTSHTYDQTRRELALYQHLVRPGGVIVLHDTELARPEDSPSTDPPFPVRRAIEEFCEREGREWLNISGSWGLGIIRF